MALEISYSPQFFDNLEGILKYFDKRNGSDNFSKKLLKMIHKLKNNDFLNSLNINPIPD